MAFDYLDEIRNKIDIVELASQYLKLQKAGSNYKALCPFHKEKTPSFFISPSKQIFHCFGCGAGGDVITFLMKIENLEFKDAVKILAEKAGVKIHYEHPEEQALKNKLLELNKQAAQFYHEQLFNNSDVLNYLKKRGLEEKTIKEFKLGFALDEWRSLISFLLKQGFSPQEMVSAGLAISKIENPNLINEKVKLHINDIYDRFRSRIIFPIEDISGNIVAFTGRIYQGEKSLKTIKNIEEVGKYVNSPQTILFDKSKILYGLSKTKTYLHSSGCTLLVEGQMDFLMGYQTGIKNIVATSGTSLTSYHLTILKKYNNILILGFDMDEAGQRAKERGIDLALNKGFEVKILELPQTKDLADYLLENKHSINSENVLNIAIPIMDFYFNRAKTIGNNKTIEGKKQIISYFLPKIKKLANLIDRSFWLEKLSQYLNIDIKVLEDELSQMPTDNRYLIDENEPENNVYAPSIQLSSLVNYNRLDLLSERILSLILKNFSEKNIIQNYLSYFPQPFNQIGELFLKAQNLDEINETNLKNNNINQDLIDKINLLFLRADYEEELIERFKVDLEEEIKKELLLLKQESIKQELKKLELQIQEAEKSNNMTLLNELISKFNILSKQLK